ncbi:breast carcinoma-amplified sequence 4 [Grus japonensis]|uniref:Breast carcinoma-amplified sequence 4 n=1 Tax=Grus japonensis TaxID=30415 RepID=A0ABC9XIK1_GRUJA
MLRPEEPPEPRAGAAAEESGAGPVARGGEVSGVVVGMSCLQTGGIIASRSAIEWKEPKAWLIEVSHDQLLTGYRCLMDLEFGNLPPEALGVKPGFITGEKRIRSDTSEILDETILLIKDKVMEMNHIYAKVDKLEVLVKMVTHHVSFPEEQVLEAGKSYGTFLKTVCKLFQCAAISSFKNRHPLSAACSRDLPKLYRTEDFFPMNYVGTKYQSN